MVPKVDVGSSFRRRFRKKTFIFRMLVSDENDGDLCCFFRHCAQTGKQISFGLPLTPCREWVHFPVCNLRVDFGSSGNV